MLGIWQVPLFAYLMLSKLACTYIPNVGGMVKFKYDVHLYLQACSVSGSDLEVKLKSGPEKFLIYLSH